MAFLKSMFIRVMLVVANVAIPIAILSFLLMTPSEVTPHKIFISIFLIAHAFERVWETFFTTKEKKVFELHGDWTLALVTLAYLLLYWIVILEYFFSGGYANWMISMAAFASYVLAFLIRFWGMKHLATQWAIHAIGVKKIGATKLIQTGPYKYVRHPIYLAIIIELISIAIIANTPFALLFCVLVNIPLQLVRLVVEEKSTIRKIGPEYEVYRKAVPALIPFWKIHKNE